MSNMIQVIFADNDVQVRSAMRLLLEQESAAPITVGEASDVISLIAETESVHPDLLLMDWELPGLRIAPSEIIASLRIIAPESKVVVLSSRPEERPCAMEAGADEFISKVDPPDGLVDKLHSVLAG